MPSWAEIEDLYIRYGEEFVDKLAIRNVWDEDVQSYVADESDENKELVLQTALDDAKALIQNKLACLYQDYILVETLEFESIKQWHIRLTIETLKIGGDCTSCACIGDLDKFLCGAICTEDGVCLVGLSTAFSVSEAFFCCELGCGKCC